MSIQVSWISQPSSKTWNGGNYGGLFKSTKHNCGFMFLDYLAKLNSLSFNYNGRIVFIFIIIQGADSCAVKIKNEKIVLMKPCASMNEIGPIVYNATGILRLSI